MCRVLPLSLATARCGRLWNVRELATAIGTIVATAQLDQALGTGQFREILLEDAFSAGPAAIVITRVPSRDLCGTESSTSGNVHEENTLAKFL